MHLLDASTEDQRNEFVRMVSTNPVVATLLDRLPALELPDCWIASGCLFQTVWNVLTGRDPGAAILDYDVNYHDPSDVSWEAEDAVIRRAAQRFADLDVHVEVRNEARVHLWYEQKYGVPCPPYRSVGHAVSTFPNCSSCVAIQPGPDGVRVLAPYGLRDLFAMVTRPNPVLAPAAVYVAKTARWREEWPALTVLPWPSTDPEDAPGALQSAQPDRQRLET